MKTYIIGKANHNRTIRIVALDKYALLSWMDMERINEGYRETNFNSTLSKIRRELEFGTSDWEIICYDDAKKIGLKRFIRYSVWGETV